MALTKVTGQVIKNTTDVTVGVLTVTNTLAVGGTVSIGGTLTYEDVTNVDAVGLITARNGIVVGSGITLSKDGDVFFTGIATGNGSGLTALNASNLGSGTVPTARLGSGTASSSTFLRGDSTFQTVNTDLVSDTTPQLGGNLDVNSKAINFGDSNGSTTNLAQFGADTDLRIYHEDGVGNVINSYSSNAFKIFTNGNTEILTNNGELCAKFVKNGAVSLYYDNVEQLATGSGSIYAKSILPSSHETYDIGQNMGRWNDIYIADNGKLKIGQDNDLQIFHDGSNSYVRETGTGSLFIEGNSDIYIGKASGGAENGIVYNVDSSVDLYHNNSKKFETHDVGTIFTQASNSVANGAIKVNTTLDNYGSIIVRNQSHSNTTISALEIENNSNGTNETNFVLRSVNLGSTAWSHAFYGAKSHRFGIEANVDNAIKFQVDLDGIKFNGDQASDNALYDYEEGNHNPTDASGAGITLSQNNAGRYTKIGRLVVVSFDITYGTTSHGGLASITPPFTNGLNYGQGVIGWTSMGRPCQIHVSGGNVYLMDNDSNSGNQKHITNAEASNVRFIGNYTMQINE